MLHLKEKVIREIEVKKSKFICVLLPLSDDKQIKETINQLKKDYPNASHYCYGSIIAGNYRSSDDGEPSSTAGKPILQILINKQLDNCLAVVIRYFGGTLLGTNGLVKAYSQATIEAIKNATLTSPTEVTNYKISIPLSLVSKIEYFLNKNATITNKEYDQQATYYFQTKNDLTSRLDELTSGQFKSIELNKEIIENAISQ